ncbi:MAG: glycoside hydrolase family 97 N-terminal domain-containing protein, partial [Marinilabiliaceae bacterium]|nr:glycoside hydrolase family 97 N-terminal domain-containing protein [Marinilabiliaceae bacterium]
MNTIIRVALLMIAIITVPNAMAKDKVYRVSSPDKKIEVVVNLSDQIRFSVKHDGQEIISPSQIAMELPNVTLGQNPVVVKVEKRSIDETIQPVVKIKEAQIANQCNELKVIYEGDYAIRFRAYNDGVAYRFETNKDGEITVVSETGNYAFPENYMCWWGREKRFQSNNQVYYDYTSLQKLGEQDMASLPLILNPANGPKIVIAETDLI